MSKALITASWADVPHLSERMKEQILASVPAHERDARTKGIPTLGSGAIYPFEKELLAVEPFSIPDHWPRICGMDFGWDHPTALVWQAWDRDSDTVYVYDLYTARKTPPPIIASAAKARGAWIPVAWPRDGYAADGKRDGIALKTVYEEEGVAMLPEAATSSDGSVSVEASIMVIHKAMLEGRFKVFNHLNDWFSEQSTYHRKDGKIVKIRDDIMDGTRYGHMMLRFAKTHPRPRDKRAANRVRDWRTA